MTKGKLVTEIAEFAKLASEEMEADVLLLNAPMQYGLEKQVRKLIKSRSSRKERIVVILVSAGGLADSAYRTCTAVRSFYKNVTICVPGWCKSAGTLMAIGADDLIIGCDGELGPLDVQIAVKDELVDNRDSGLILDAAIEGLNDNAFKIFEKFMTSVIERSQGAVTFKTAADLATQMTIGLMSPIFEKIDPLRMGADHRAQKIGRDYAIRLNIKAENLRGHDALNMLLNGYPSHGFAIDFDEAERLFTNVKPLEGYLEQMIEALGEVAQAPVGDEAVVLFLNGEADEASDTGAASNGHEGDGEAAKIDDNIASIAPKNLRGAVQTES